jgi:hypothetical protein
VCNVPKAVGHNSPNDPVHIPLEHHPPSPIHTHSHTLPPHNTTTGWYHQGVGAAHGGKHGSNALECCIGQRAPARNSNISSPALTASLESSMVPTSRLLVLLCQWHWVETVPDRLSQGNTWLTALSKEQLDIGEPMRPGPLVNPAPTMTPACQPAKTCPHMNQCKIRACRSLGGTVQRCHPCPV